MILASDAMDFCICEVIDNLRREKIRKLLNQTSLNSKDTNIIDNSLQSNLTKLAVLY
jgi:hypothetical protein